VLVKALVLEQLRCRQLRDPEILRKTVVELAGKVGPIGIPE
jgi:hypothetical protein